MGLEDFNIAPDNKGGRKKKEEKQDNSPRTRMVDGEAFTMEDDTKEWWQEQLRAEVVEQSGDNIEEKIPTLAGYVFMNPVSVRIKLEEHEIHETDWDQYVEDHPVYEEDQRILDHLGEVDNSSSSSTDFLSSEESEDSGLASLVKDAK